MNTALGRYRVATGGALRLADVDPRDTSAFRGDREAAQRRCQQLGARLGHLQEALYAQGRHRLLVVLQAMDAGGKDAVVRAVFADVDPQGVRVTCFKRPTPAELARDYLWRVHLHVPAAGEIAIWNRSHYEDVIVARVHDHVEESRWRRRFEHIVAFERMLAEEGTTIVKLFLHISKEEQRERLQNRIDDPGKRWKWNPTDLDERARWRDYQEAYEEALAATSTDWGPWHVVPADRSWYRDLVVGEILVGALEALDIRLPPGEPGIEGMRVT